MHLFGKKGFLYAQLVTLLFAAAGLGLALFLKAAVMGLRFGLWGFRAVSVIQAYLRGELPASAAADPMMISMVASLMSYTAAISQRPQPAIATADGQPSARNPGVSLVEGSA
jgi:hypothetical protein